LPASSVALSFMETSEPEIELIRMFFLVPMNWSLTKLSKLKGSESELDLPEVDLPQSSKKSSRPVEHSANGIP